MLCTSPSFDSPTLLDLSLGSGSSTPRTRTIVFFFAFAWISASGYQVLDLDAHLIGLDGSFTCFLLCRRIAHTHCLLHCVRTPFWFRTTHVHKHAIHLSAVYTAPLVGFELRLCTATAPRTSYCSHHAAAFLHRTCFVFTTTVHWAAATHATSASTPLRSWHAVSCCRTPAPVVPYTRGSHSVHRQHNRARRLSTRGTATHTIFIFVLHCGPTLTLPYGSWFAHTFTRLYFSGLVLRTVYFLNNTHNNNSRSGAHERLIITRTLYKIFLPLRTWHTSVATVADLLHAVSACSRAVHIRRAGLRSGSAAHYSAAHARTSARTCTGFTSRTRKLHTCILVWFAVLSRAALRDAVYAGLPTRTHATALRLRFIFPILSLPPVPLPVVRLVLYRAHAVALHTPTLYTYHVRFPLHCLCWFLHSSLAPRAPGASFVILRPHTPPCAYIRFTPLLTHLLRTQFGLTLHIGLRFILRFASHHLRLMCACHAVARRSCGLLTAFAHRRTAHGFHCLHNTVTFCLTSATLPATSLCPHCAHLAHSCSALSVLAGLPRIWVLLASLDINFTFWFRFWFGFACLSCTLRWDYTTHSLTSPFALFSSRTRFSALTRRSYAYFGS